MSKRLPSLTSLRSFEAAARHLSFAQAAGELHVTPAAIGFQIKQLEEELGGALFLRKHRAVALTDKGRTLLRNLGPVFKNIQDAWDTAHEPDDLRTLRVTGPAKAIHSWVLPALSDAKPTMPGVQIAWDLSKEMRDVADGKVDFAVRWAKEPEGDLHWAPVLRTWFTPLVRPDVVRFVQGPGDLEKQGLIGVEYVPDIGATESVWDVWYRSMECAAPRNYAVTCADTAVAVETALATGHVAIGGSFLAYEPLSKGEIVAPFDVAVAPYSRFWLVCQKGQEKSDEFRWMLEAMERGRQKIDALAKRMTIVHPDGRALQRQS